MDKKCKVLSHFPRFHRFNTCRFKLMCEIQQTIIFIQLCPKQTKNNIISFAGTEQLNIHKHNMMLVHVHSFTTWRFKFVCEIQHTMLFIQLCPKHAKITLLQQKVHKQRNKQKRDIILFVHIHGFIGLVKKNIMYSNKSNHMCSSPWVQANTEAILLVLVSCPFLCSLEMSSDSPMSSLL